MRAIYAEHFEFEHVSQSSYVITKLSVICRLFVFISNSPNDITTDLAYMQITIVTLSLGIAIPNPGIPAEFSNRVIPGLKNSPLRCMLINQS